MYLKWAEHVSVLPLSENGILNTSKTSFRMLCSKTSATLPIFHKLQIFVVLNPGINQGGSFSPSSDDNRPHQMVFIKIYRFYTVFPLKVLSTDFPKQNKSEPPSKKFVWIQHQVFDCLTQCFIVYTYYILLSGHNLDKLFFQTYCNYIKYIKIY